MNLSRFAAALLLAAGLVSTLPAQYAPAGYRYARSPHWSTQPQYCPPGYAPPGYAPPGYAPYPQQPMTPQRQGQASPQQPTTPDGQQQPSQQRDTQPQQPSTTQQAQTQQDQQSQQNQQQQQQQQQQQPDFTPSPDTSSRASLSPGANTPQLGRNDQINRLNLFDNMSAAPQSRAWVGYQAVAGFNTGLRGTDEFIHFVQPRPIFERSTDTFVDSFGTTIRTDTIREVFRDSPADVDAILRQYTGIDTTFFRYNQRLFRVGVEWAPCNCDCFSVSVQGQHVNPEADGPDEDWTNPQIMLKWAFARDCDTVVSAILGVTPETETDVGEINEPDTKIYPGLLFYEGITDCLFLQGGFQFGIPMHRNEVDTADWSVSLGYWLYRDTYPHHAYCGPPNLLRAFKITGIIPQINLLGKHTLNNHLIVGPFGLPTAVPNLSTNATEVITETVTETPSGIGGGGGSTVTTTVTSTPTILTQSFPAGLVIYDEPTAVLDFTVGGQIIFANSIQVGLGYSFPITHGEVRDGEFLSNVTYLF